MLPKNKMNKISLFLDKNEKTPRLVYRGYFLWAILKKHLESILEETIVRNYVDGKYLNETELVFIGLNE